MQHGLRIQTGPHLCEFVTFAVAWTLADLAGRTSPGRDEVAVALSFRQPGASR